MRRARRPPSLGNALLNWPDKTSPDFVDRHYRAHGDDEPALHIMDSLIIVRAVRW